MDCERGSATVRWYQKVIDATVSNHCAHVHPYVTNRFGDDLSKVCPLLHPSKSRKEVVDFYNRIYPLSRCGGARRLVRIFRKASAAAQQSLGDNVASELDDSTNVNTQRSEDETAVAEATADVSELSYDPTADALPLWGDADAGSLSPRTSDRAAGDLRQGRGKRARRLQRLSVTAEPTANVITRRRAVTAGSSDGGRAPSALAASPSHKIEDIGAEEVSGNQPDKSNKAIKAEMCPQKHCLCGQQVSPDEPRVLPCKGTNCPHGWVHASCVGLEWVPDVAMESMIGKYVCPPCIMNSRNDAAPRAS